MFSLTDKTAVVTGASRGIGRAIAERLAENGAHVVLVSRHQEAIDHVTSKINQSNYSARAIACDISDENQANQLIKSVVQSQGKIDILVNNAGITRDGLVMRMKSEDWQTVLDINLKGTFHCTRAVMRPMMKQRQGRIINISSVVGLTGNPGQANYAASKAGIIGLTKSVAKEVASRGITVNCIAPGYVETDMTDGLSDDVKQSLLEQIPLGRIGQGNDIAAVVHFLASDDAAYITGQTIPVDGGMVMM